MNQQTDQERFGGQHETGCRSITLPLVAAAILALMGSSAASAQTVTTFNATATSTNTFPTVINLGGTVAGYFIDSTGFHGFLRGPDGTITTFNPPLDSSGSTTLFSLNNPGAVVGTYTNPSFVETGFLRDPSGGFTDIAPPGSTLTGVNLYINDSGVIAGSYVDSSLPRKSHGFVRDASGNYTSFDVPGATGITIASIDSSGQIAGYYSDSAFHNHGFVRDSSGAITTFDAPSPDTDIAVYSMNDNQEITGYSRVGSTYQGFVRQGTTITLFDGDPTRTQTLPQSINYSGTIVGYDCISFGSCNGFVRSPLGAIASLEVPGASNTQPTGVNDLGTIEGIWLDASFNRHGFVAAFTSPVPPGSGTSCNGTYDSTFNGNVTVSAGQTCNFVGGGINGNVTLSGGTLGLSSATVSGNVQIGGGTFAIGPSTTIKGNLQIGNLPGPSSQNQVCGTTIQGNLQFHNNETAVQIGGNVACPGNTISGGLQVENNSAAVTIVNNTVSGNLQCSGNASITGSGNTVTGHKQGQCAAF